MNDSIMVLDMGRRALEIKAETHARIAEALEVAAMVGNVSTPEQNDAACAAHKGIKSIRSELEKGRKICKEPILEFGRAIDAAVKTVDVPLAEEDERLARATGEFAAVQEAKRKAEIAARVLEEQRIEKERQAEVDRIREQELREKLEIEKKEREAAMAAANARSAAARAEAEKLAEEAKRQRIIAEAKSLDAITKANEDFAQRQADVAPVSAPVRADGQIVKRRAAIDEIREWELLKARPDLVRKIEFDLVSIKQELERGAEIKGVKWHWETKSTVSVGPRAAVLEIGGGR